MQPPGHLSPIFRVGAVIRGTAFPPFRTTLYHVIVTPADFRVVIGAKVRQVMPYFYLGCGQTYNDTVYLDISVTVAVALEPGLQVSGVAPVIELPKVLAELLDVVQSPAFNLGAGSPYKVFRNYIPT